MYTFHVETKHESGRTEVLESPVFTLMMLPVRSQNWKPSIFTYYNTEPNFTTQIIVTKLNVYNSTEVWQKLHVRSKDHKTRKWPLLWQHMTTISKCHTYHTAKSLAELVTSNVRHSRVNISVIIVPCSHTLKLHLWTTQQHHHTYHIAVIININITS